MFDWKLETQISFHCIHLSLSNKKNHFATLLKTIFAKNFSPATIIAYLISKYLATLIATVCNCRIIYRFYSSPVATFGIAYFTFSFKSECIKKPPNHFETNFSAPGVKQTRCKAVSKSLSFYR